MKLGVNGAFTKMSKKWGLHSMDNLLMAKDLWWWKKDMKSVQAAKARSGSYAHLPSSSPNKQVLQVTTMCQAMDCRIPSKARCQERQTLKKTFASQQFMWKVVILSTQTNKHQAFQNQDVSFVLTDLVMSLKACFRMLWNAYCHPWTQSTLQNTLVFWFSWCMATGKDTFKDFFLLKYNNRFC